MRGRGVGVVLAAVLAAIAAVQAENVSFGKPAGAGVWKAGLQRRVTHMSQREFRHPARRLQEPTEEVPIYGDFRDLAYYYADVFVGTPPQKFTVIADTGSTLLAFPCKNCQTCGRHMDPKFDVAASSTVHPVGCSDGHSCSRCTSHQCGYHQSYAEGSSLTGVYYRDRVWLGGDSSSTAEGDEYGIQYAFGCNTAETKLFKTQDADGIMGLSQSSQSLVSAIAASGKLSRHMFSMCLTLDGEGTFVLGGIDETHHTAPVAWAAMTSATTFYTITVAKVTFGSGTTLTHGRFNSGGHTIVDSGTSFTYLPSDTFGQVKSSTETYCARAENCKGSRITVQYESICYRLAHPRDLETFPSMAIELAGANGGPNVVVNFSPSKLFVNMAWDEGAYCLGVYSNGAAGGVIGANAMLDYDVIFDLEPHSRRIGFAPSNCVYTAPEEAAPTPSSTPTVSLTATATVTGTPTVSGTPSLSMSNTATSTISSSAPPTHVPGSTPTATRSPTPTTSVPAAASPSPSPTTSAGLPGVPFAGSVHRKIDEAAAGTDGSTTDFMSGLVVGLGLFVVVVVGAVCFVAVSRRNIAFGSVQLTRFTQLQPATSPSTVGQAGVDDDGLDDDRSDSPLQDGTPRPRRGAGRLSSV